MKNETAITNFKPTLNIMKYIQIYLTFTLIFYFIGPVRWQTQNTILMVLMVLLFQFSFYFGYKYQMEKPVKKPINSICDITFFIKHFNVFAFISIALDVLLLVRITSLYKINSVLKTIALSFTDPAVLYSSVGYTKLSSEMFGGQALALINALFSPISFMLIPVGLVSFKKLKFGSRILFIFAFAANLFSTLSSGRGEGILRIVLCFLILFMIGGKRNNNNRRLNKVVRIVLIVGVVVLFLIIYSALMNNRTHGSYHLPLGNNHIDYHNWTFKILSKELQNLMVYLHIYLTEGYFGMSLCLGADWFPMFGTGFSPWFRGEVEGIIGTELKMYTLMAQPNHFNWKYGVNWHTAYTWFACDVWWIGVPVIMFFFGRILAKAYKDAYNTKSPISIGMLSLMMLFVIFLPANNYLFSDSDTFLSFFIYLLLWGVKFALGEKKVQRA